ncbi:MAG: protein-L-isoaspartate O-methyltransferase [Hyphomicrobiales bacterium]|nr:protein-L-isoaspartate O-methyltransferase [Hyphomicrobiales bacterium]
MQTQPQTAANVDPAMLRQTAVDCQIRPFGVSDQGVLARFLDVPREMFAPAGVESLIYSDSELRHPLAAGGYRAMLAPLVLARMLQAAEIGPADVVLDVAGATGYTAALVSGLAGKVVALESDAGLSAAAAANFKALGLANVEAFKGALRDGSAAKGPFDVVIVNGAAEEGLDQLLAQLSPAGRLLTLHPQTAGAAQVVLYRRDGSSFSRLSLLEGAGKIVPEFARKPGFAF